MELAFVLLAVLVGTGAIVYAGMHSSNKKPDPSSSSGDMPIIPTSRNHGDAASGSDGGSDGGGDGD